MTTPDDDLVEAIGKASEALEYVERARGHLYSFHQLLGHADLEFGAAADLLEQCGLQDAADAMRDEVVGRNVLDGRWTFQVVEEFDDLYYAPAVDAVPRARTRPPRRPAARARVANERAATNEGPGRSREPSAGRDLAGGRPRTKPLRDPDR